MPVLTDARIGQIAIVCADVQRARAFYLDVLGLRHLFDAGPALSFFDCDGVRLMLTAASAEENRHASSILYYFVSDIDAVHRDLAARQVPFLEAPHVVATMPDHQLWLAAFRDSEGNLLALMEERRGPGREECSRRLTLSESG